MLCIGLLRVLVLLELCNEYFYFFFLISLCIKHPNLFGGSEKLDVSWDKGLYDSNILVAYRRPRPEWLAQQSFVLQVDCTFLSFYSML